MDEDTRQRHPNPRKDSQLEVSKTRRKSSNIGDKGVPNVWRSSSRRVKLKVQCCDQVGFEEPGTQCGMMQTQDWLCVLSVLCWYRNMFAKHMNAAPNRRAQVFLFRWWDIGCQLDLGHFGFMMFYVKRMWSWICITPAWMQRFICKTSRFEI